MITPMVSLEKMALENPCPNFRAKVVVISIADVTFHRGWVSSCWMDGSFPLACVGVRNIMYYTRLRETLIGC